MFILLKRTATEKWAHSEKLLACLSANTLFQTLTTRKKIHLLDGIMIVANKTIMNMHKDVSKNTPKEVRESFKGGLKARLTNKLSTSLLICSKLIKQLRGQGIVYLEQ